MPQRCANNLGLVRIMEGFDLSNGIKDLVHGTTGAYRNAKCRCRVCKDAHNLRIREYNAKVKARDGVTHSAQLKRKQRGVDPLKPVTYPLCIVCEKVLKNPSNSERPMHKFCKDTARWKVLGLPDPAIEREELRAERERKAAEYKAKDHRSDIRAGYEDGDFDRFMRGLRFRTKLSDSGCMEWQGRIKNGYPYAKIGGSMVGVHRLSIEMREGKPLGVLAAHHICANSICVNPEHLQPVTQRENSAEMMARTSLEARIEELEQALRDVAPHHEALNRISHKQAA